MWGGRVVAVSTITMRALGQPAKFGPGCDDTNISSPGFGFAVVDLLLITSISQKHADDAGQRFLVQTHPWRFMPTPSPSATVFFSYRVRCCWSEHGSADRWF
jgi:hypothetical protein